MIYAIIIIFIRLLLSTHKLSDAKRLKSFLK